MTRDRDRSRSRSRTLSPRRCDLKSKKKKPVPEEEDLAVWSKNKEKEHQKTLEKLRKNRESAEAKAEAKKRQDEEDTRFAEEKRIQDEIQAEKQAVIDFYMEAENERHKESEEQAYDEVTSRPLPHQTTPEGVTHLIGTSAFGIEMVPSVVHFGGFQIHKEHVTLVRILNTSSASLRVTIIPPNTKYFSITYEKKGLLAAGMSEDLYINFKPFEWKYYYDTIKVLIGIDDENITIPVHGYPAINDLKIPRFIDFGNVAIGVSKMMVLSLNCSVPIEFEYEIRILEDHEDFEITQLRGIIPAHGAYNVSIGFLPIRPRTSIMKIGLRIKQFNSQEIMIDIMGNSLAETTRNELVDTGVKDLNMIQEKRREEDKKMRYDALEEKKRRGELKPLKLKMPIFPEPDPEIVLEDIPIPRPDKPHALDSVLKHKPGKLPLKAFRSFVLNQREKADARMAQAIEDADADTLDDDYSDSDMNAKEMRFEIKWRNTENYDKGKELKGISEIGENTFTENQKNSVTTGRAKKQDRLWSDALENARERTESSFTIQAPSVIVGYTMAKKPTWDEYANDTFAMRLQTIDRFVRAGSRCLMRVRATARLQKLREAMVAAGAKDRETTKAWVEAENKAAAMGGKVKTDSTAAGSCFKMPLQACPPPIPTIAMSMDSESFQPVHIDMIDNFIEYLPLELAPRDCYKVEDYQPIPVPPPSQYMLSNEGRRIPHIGCLDELFIRGSRGHAFDGAEKPVPRPQSCLAIPKHDPMEVCVPSPNVRIWFGSAYDFCETDLEYRLSEPIPRRPWKTRSHLVLPTLENEEIWLHTWRQNRQVCDAFSVYDPFPDSLAPGREKLGPITGGSLCPGNQGLVMLPHTNQDGHGGFPFDIPSDTDSDDRDEEFDIPRPDPETYLADFFDDPDMILKPDDPIELEFQQLEDALEDKLEQQARARNVAFRNKISELNNELNARNKLYLG